MNIRSLVAASLITAGAVSMSASAALVAGWSMSTAVAAATTGSNYNYGAANLGDATSGTMLSGFHAVAATTWSSPAGNGSTYSLSSNNWSIGDYYQVSLSTIGYADPIALSFDQTRSGTGPAAFEVLMSVDGGASFSSVLAGYTVIQAGLAGSGTTTWNSVTNQPVTFTTTVSGLSAAAGQASVIFRIQSTVTTAAAGTNRVDNINVYSGAVPTPGAIALLGVAGLVGRRRR
jgi:MYXO-CTERM domain-containing protein